MKTQKGFTLIEILVVISIIGILSGIIVVGLDSAKTSSRDARRIADLKNIQLALALYYQDNGHYPCRLDDSSVQGNTWCQPQFIGNYLNTLPNDPSTTLSYYYTAMTRSSGIPPVSCSTGVSFYHLGARVENSTGSYMNQDDLYVMDASGRITVAGNTYTHCSSSAYGSFHSDALNCAAGTYSASTPDPCYSVGPQ